jgi:hypothetical protein
MTSTMMAETNTKNARQRLINRVIGRRNMAKAAAEANAQRPTPNVQFRKVQL